MAFGQYLGYIGGVIGAIIGGVIGSYFPVVGTSAGAMWGFSIGSMLGGVAGQVFWPEQAELNLPPPPQPHETRLQFSSWGMPIPIQYGSGRMAGNIIYMSDINQTVERSRHREDGVRYYEIINTYTATFAIAFCEGPVEGIARIWVNNKVFADFRDENSPYYPVGDFGLIAGNLETTIARSTAFFDPYYGGANQTYNTGIAALITAAETPAYKGMCYVVFRDFPIGEFSGVPNIEVEVGAIAHGFWIKREPCEITTNTYWRQACISNDGIVMLAIRQGDFSTNSLYISTDFGLTWSLTGDVKSYERIAINGDGSRIYAGTSTVGIYNTGDYGASWAEMSPDATKGWYCIETNNEGSFVLAGATPGRLYISTDYGTSWTETQPAGAADKSWWRGACSDDGSVLIVTEAGNLYVSTDSGLSWDLRLSSGYIYGGVCCNYDGTIQYAAAGDSGRIFKSIDSGVTWVQHNPAGAVDRYWRSPISCDASGAKVAVLEQANYLYYSNDYGETWEYDSPGSVVSPFWNSLKMGHNGDLIICCYYTNGGIFTYRN